MMNLLLSFLLLLPSGQPECSCSTFEGGSRITVTLTGGANAGTYTVSTPKTTCSKGLTGPASFGNQYSEKGKSDAEFSSLQLIVDDASAAGTGTDKFYVKVAFGKVLVGRKYEINGSSNPMAGAKTGKGTLSLKEGGGKKTVTLEGETADGVKIRVTLECFKTLVNRNGTYVEE
ncbi:hypothetical protein [Siphonobacter aquaeclarae]|jgi:hypothetical protein|uniref:Uncharacterized protein n=1 Tax=Siphonobacter aquaeclarae TaxID=563176 RepID=A0A1G9W5X7_9BACT|nr:hypothetical protein [Siphonobacter aquaeclarae]SDM79928.1 hypothetical protein SAMN04488090_4263 [Siphonobacter aquaeclarae]